jgi:plasmid stabilization system protein ParE
MIFGFTSPLAVGNVEIADRVVDRITNRFFFLATCPYAGRRRDQDLKPGLRSFPPGEYVIIYRVENDDVRISMYCVEARISKGGRSV